MGLRYYIVGDEGVAQAYRAAGAEVFNIPDLASPRPGE